MTEELLEVTGIHPNNCTFPQPAAGRRKENVPAGERERASARWKVDEDAGAHNSIHTLTFGPDYVIRLMKKRKTARKGGRLWS